MKIITKGLWLQELRDLVFAYQDAPAALGYKAIDWVALSMISGQQPGSATISVRQQAAARRQRRIMLVVASLPDAHQSVLRQCYDATGSPASDRATKYGAAAGAARAAWAKSSQLRLLEQELRLPAEKKHKQKLRQLREQMLDDLGWRAWVKAVAAHESYALAKAAQQDWELAEARAAAERGDVEPLRQLRETEAKPSEHELAVAETAALVMQLRELMGL